MYHCRSSFGLWFRITALQSAVSPDCRTGLTRRFASRLTVLQHSLGHTASGYAIFWSWSTPVLICRSPSLLLPVMWLPNFWIILIISPWVKGQTELSLPCKFFSLRGLELAEGVLTHRQVCATRCWENTKYVSKCPIDDEICLCREVEYRTVRDPTFKCVKQNES